MCAQRAAWRNRFRLPFRACTIFRPMSQADLQRAGRKLPERRSRPSTAFSCNCRCPRGDLDTADALERIDPGKDVDGIHPVNAGLLATGATDRAGALRPSARWADQAHLRGARPGGRNAQEAIVIGRST